MEKASVKRIFLTWLPMFVVAVILCWRTIAQNTHSLAPAVLDPGICHNKTGNENRPVQININWASYGNLNSNQ